MTHNSTPTWWLAALILASGIASAKEPEVVQLSPDTYMISKEDHGEIFGNLSKMKVKIIRQANAFAAGPQSCFTSAINPGSKGG